MSMRVHDTRRGGDPGFEREWSALLSRSPLANFTLDPRFLAWEARHGRHALAVLLEEGERRAALVLRAMGAALVSGWPWRWQAVVEGPEPATATLAAGDCTWLFDRARAVAGARRLRFFLPAAASAQSGGFPAGGTRLRALDGDDDAFLATMDVNKRRGVKRALREGWEVREAAGLEDFLAFARLQREVELARGTRVPEIPTAPPESGEAWSEWELPWMWLLVAVREGIVGAGSGYGFSVGGTVEYRANASTAEARKAGVNALLAWEALRRGRDRGCRWMSWGGTNEFKRELGGGHVEIFCRLGGGLAWAPLNGATIAWHHARRRLPEVVRSLGRGRGES
jgi:hypothetical protein